MRARLVVVGAIGFVLAIAVGSATASANAIWATCSWGSQSQTCDSATWYSSALTVVWHADPPPDAAGCQLGIRYHYDTDGVTAISCSATWIGSPTETLTQSYTVHVETSSPTASATPTRPPDSGGWYNHPLAVGFHGSAFSGIASCTSATYTGPNSPTATITGGCIDNAGKVAGASLTVRYDSSPPAVRVATGTGDRAVRLDWAGTADVAPITSVKVTRRPGLHGRKSSVVYKGPGAGFRDLRVLDGVRYRYTVTATDQAGNRASRTVAATPGPRLLWPPNGANFAGPPRLSWTPVRGASYYNVQVYRGGKVLSRWPARASFQLRTSWRFRGRRHHLRPGHYSWFVWPGYGPRRAARYGPMIGSGSFVVTG